MTPERTKASAEYFYSRAAEEDPRESVRCSYLAALKGAGLVVAAHPQVERMRPRTRDVWTMLGRTSSEWDEDILYFRRLATLRRDIEMGLSVAVSAEMATTFSTGWESFWTA